MLEFLNRRAARVTAQAVVLGAVVGGTARPTPTRGKSVTLSSTVSAAPSTPTPTPSGASSRTSTSTSPPARHRGPGRPTREGRRAGRRPVRPALHRGRRRRAPAPTGPPLSPWTTPSPPSASARTAPAVGVRSMPLGRQGSTWPSRRRRAVTMTVDGHGAGTGRTTARPCRTCWPSRAGPRRRRPALGGRDHRGTRRPGRRHARIGRPSQRRGRGRAVRRPRSAARHLYTGQTKVDTGQARRGERSTTSCRATAGSTTKPSGRAVTYGRRRTRVVQVGTKASRRPGAPRPERSAVAAGAASAAARRAQLGRAGQVRVRRQPARGQPGRLLRPVPVQPGDLALRRRQRQPDRRLAGRADSPRQDALQRGRRRRSGAAARHLFD